MVSFRLIARPLLALPFLVDGADALLRPKKHADLLREDRSGLLAASRPVLERAGVPTTLLDEPEPIVRFSGAVTALSALALATGRTPRLAAFMLAGVAAKTALVRHPVWRAEDGEERREQVFALATRAGLVGGALVAAGDRAGEPSWSWRVTNARQQRAKIREVKARSKK